VPTNTLDSTIAAASSTTETSKPAASSATETVKSAPVELDAAPVTQSTPSTSAAAAEPSTTTTSGSSSELGGLEAKGAHETGKFFPSVVRHDTNMSISKLHVPGEFPKKE
jgi:hypothetical protein